MIEHDSYLMSPEDLIRVTGKRRRVKQVEWFKATFGIDVVVAGDGQVIMPWATFTALSNRKAGLAVGGEAPKRKFELCYD